MIEAIVKPQPLDNDRAVMQILHLMGQLSPTDIQYVMGVLSQVYKAIEAAPITRYKDMHWEAHL